MTLEEIEARWKEEVPINAWAADNRRTSARSDVTYLLDRVRKLEDCKQRVRAKLAECDAEATLRGLSATGFPRLWFASLSRAVGLELRSPLASMTGTGNEGSIPLAAALDSLSSPALAEMRLQMEKYKRAHAWFVENTNTNDSRRVVDHCQYCGRCDWARFPHDCAWVKARDLTL